MPDSSESHARELILPMAKAEGAFLALAAGDALGWPQEMPRNVRGNSANKGVHVEFKEWTRRSGGRFYPYEEKIHAGDYSDDTQLTLAVARSRTNYGSAWWKAFAGVELPLWTLYERGGGSAMKRAARAWCEGNPPWKLRKHNGVHQYFEAGGNGVAMRVLPHALFLAGQDRPAVLMRDVVLDGTLTHGHPRALVGATVYAYAAWSLARRSGTLRFGELLDMLIDESSEWSRFPESDREGGSWFDAANGATGGRYESIWSQTIDEMLALLEKTRKTIQAGALADDHGVLQELGCFGRAKGAGTITTAAAVYLVARYAAQPMQGVIRAAFEKGADTDTLAAMVGGLMGCLAGVEWLPLPWLKVQDAGYLQHLASRVALGPEGACQNPVPSLSSLRSVGSDLAATRTGEVTLGGALRGQVFTLPDPKPIAKSIHVRAWRVQAFDGQTLYLTKIDRLPKKIAAQRSNKTAKALSLFGNEADSIGTRRDAGTAPVQGRRRRYPGARWWKFDFHTHTPASADYGKGPAQSSLKQISPSKWLLDFMRAEVDCVAVTDHNSGEWVDRLKQALNDLEQDRHPEFRPLHLFPGVEITANGGIHVLGILDTASAASDIATLLGTVGYRGERGASDVSVGMSPLSVVEAIHKTGGIPILAHVDKPLSGAWGLKGNTLAPILDFDGLFAMKVVDPYFQSPELYRQHKLVWSDVLGSDSYHPVGEAENQFPGSHYTWVKMAKPSLEGLRLALLDGSGFSVCRSDAQELFDPFLTPKHCIESVEIANARYMGHGKPVKLNFSPWLNALIGGRGTGKSTVVHALRLVARRGDELTHLEERSGARLTFKRFNRVPLNRMDEGGLTDKTMIQWTVVRDGVRHRVYWRQDGAGMVVENESGDGDWKPSPAQTVTPDRFPLRVFSQGQIAELAGDSQQALLQVIDEVAGVSAYRDKLNEACHAFFASRARIRELDDKLGRQDHLIVALQDVERKLRHFEEAGHTGVLTTYRHRDRQRREANRQLESAEMAAQRIETMAAYLQSEDLPEGLIAEASQEDRQFAGCMAALGDAVDSAAQGMRDVAQRLREMVEAQRETLMKGSWQTAVEQATGSYESLVEALESEGVSDPNEYGQLVQERQWLEGEMKNLESEKEERDGWVEQSQERLREVQEARRAISAARHAFLSETLAKNRFVRIEILRYGHDPHTIESSLRQTLNVLDDRFEGDILTLEDNRPVRGVVAALLVESSEEEMPRSEQVEQRLDDFKRRLTMACVGQGDFGDHFNNYLERNFTQGPDFLDRLLTWFPEDGLSVTYSPAGDGTDFRPITQASAGQRSAAMLAFLLAHGEEPLVLDQPEDDLDNHLIYDLVVRQIRENKLRRQIIVVTHNPNIVVNGDAEMLHALDFAQGQCIIRQSGSLQEEAMRAEVCRVMEGGLEAFERRYRRLGREPTRV